MELIIAFAVGFLLSVIIDFVSCLIGGCNAKRNVNKAVRVIQGYCDKMENCEKCRFYVDGCAFQNYAPIEWEHELGKRGVNISGK